MHQSASKYNLKCKLRYYWGVCAVNCIVVDVPTWLQLIITHFNSIVIHIHCQIQRKDKTSQTINLNLKNRLHLLVSWGAGGRLNQAWLRPWINFPPKQKRSALLSGTKWFPQVARQTAVRLSARPDATARVIEFLFKAYSKVWHSHCVDSPLGSGLCWAQPGCCYSVPPRQYANHSKYSHIK